MWISEIVWVVGREDAGESDPLVIDVHDDRHIFVMFVC